MYPSRRAEETLNLLRDSQPQNIRTDLINQAEVCAQLAIADALQNIASSIDDLKKSFISVEIVAPVQLELRDPLQVEHKEI